MIETDAMDQYDDVSGIALLPIVRMHLGKRRSLSLGDAKY